MPIGDILQVILITALVMLPLGHFMGQRLQKWRKNCRQLLRQPRYLKSEGVWQNTTESQTQAKSKNEK